MRGGKRAGSGRKTGPNGPKGAITLWLSVDVTKFLKTFGRHRSKKTDETLRNTIAFIEWSRSRANDTEPTIDDKGRSGVSAGQHRIANDPNQ